MCHYIGSHRGHLQQVVMRLGLDLDYQQTNDQKPVSIRIAIFQVYLEPSVCEPVWSVR
jgi:hypothetical protein